jgi:hypothetical protein
VDLLTWVIATPVLRAVGCCEYVNGYELVVAFSRSMIVRRCQFSLFLDITHIVFCTNLTLKLVSLFLLVLDVKT